MYVDGAPTATEGTRTVTPPSPGLAPMVSSDGLYLAQLLALPEGLMVIDGANRVLWSNPQLDALWQSERPLAGRAVAEVVDDWTPRLVESDADAMRSSLAGPVSQTSGHGTWSLRDGRIIEWTHHALVLEKAATPFHLWRFRDATAQTRTERSLAASNARLQDLNRSKALFINTAAHELATPLTPVALQVALLESESVGPLTDRQRHAVGIIARNVDRLRDLLKDIIDTSDAESGRLELDLRPKNLAEVANDVVETMQAKAAARHVRLRTELDPQLWTRCDAGRIAQAIRNLVDNAIKFSRPDQDVVVRGRRDGPSVVLAVQDHGKGISASDFHRLFQPFSHTPKNAWGDEGRGLGLVLAQGIVQAHGGRIWCESAGTDRGATFTLSVPFHEPEGETRGRPRPAPWKLIQFRCPVCESRDINMRILQNRYECGACRHVWR